MIWLCKQDIALNQSISECMTLNETVSTYNLECDDNKYCYSLAKWATEFTVKYSSAKSARMAINILFEIHS